MTRYSTDYGFFELNPFPGSNQIVVSNHAFVHPSERDKGHGQKAHLERLDLAKKLGYDFIVCTVVKTNEKQIHILTKFGWSKLTEFSSTETGNVVCLFGKHLNRGAL